MSLQCVSLLGLLEGQSSILRVSLRKLMLLDINKLTVLVRGIVPPRRGASPLSK